MQAGEFLGILGPSGSGKSSLLYLLSGLKTPSHGRVTVDGRDLASMGDEARSRLRLREFGFVFQQPYLLGYLTAQENVLVTQGDPDEAGDLLDRLGLAPRRVSALGSMLTLMRCCDRLTCHRMSRRKR